MRQRRSTQKGAGAGAALASEETSRRKKRVFYLRVEREIALQFALVQQVLELGKTEMLTRMVDHFRLQGVEPLEQAGTSIRKLLAPEMGAEQIFIYYYAEDFPWLTQIADTHKVRLRDLLHSVVVYYLDDLHLDLSPVCQSTSLLETVRHAASRLGS